MTPAITVDRISKQYSIGARQRDDQTLADVLTRALRRPLDLFRRKSAAPAIWALRDISFQVEAGEAVGLVGANGSGKSTLLRVLAGVTLPTAGQGAVRGRSASLLEVGTGFNPELTGRQNVFLYGSILGMGLNTIRRHFDTIVAFSGVDDFLDTPVKHYSSGMYSRLAFAVAAHLDADVLLVDEVLAVGDAAYQERCLNRLRQLRREGRTLLFASHSAAMLTGLCPRAILLQNGRLLEDGPSLQVLERYLSECGDTPEARMWAAQASPIQTEEGGISPEREWAPETAPASPIVRLRRVRVVSEAGETKATADIRSPIGIEVTYEVLKPGHALSPSLVVLNDGGQRLFPSLDLEPEWRGQPRETGRYVSTAWIPANFLADGRHRVRVALASFHPYELHCTVPEVVSFQVLDTLAGDGARGDFQGPLPGVVRPLLSWTTRFEGGA